MLKVLAPLKVFQKVKYFSKKINVITRTEITQKTAEKKSLN